MTGVPPGDLPIEFPTKLEMVLDLRTAKALCLEFAPTLPGALAGGVFCVNVKVCSEMVESQRAAVTGQKDVED